MAYSLVVRMPIWLRGFGAGKYFSLRNGQLPPFFLLSRHNFKLEWRELFAISAVPFGLRWNCNLHVYRKTFRSDQFQIQ